MTHTPGEWMARKDLDGGRDDYAIGTSDGKIDGIAVCGVRDAALIAAAPKLLAFARAFESSGMDSIGDIDVHALICDATTLPPNAGNQR